MNEIVPYVYLGGTADADNTDALSAFKIRGIVTCLSFVEKLMQKDECDCEQVENFPEYLVNLRNSLNEETFSDEDDRNSEKSNEKREIDDDSVHEVKDSIPCNDTDTTCTQLKLTETSNSVKVTKPIHRFRVCIEDRNDEPIELFFDRVTQFIHVFVTSKKAVLIHCKAGVSRSPTIVLYYLITKMNFALSNAFYHVLSKRSVICPNIGFMEQLCNEETKKRTEEMDVCNKNEQNIEENNDEQQEHQRGEEFVQTQQALPSLCMFKYMEWYTADRSWRPAVPDIDLG